MHGDGHVRSGCHKLLHPLTDNSLNTSQVSLQLMIQTSDGGHHLLYGIMADRHEAHSSFGEHLTQVLGHTIQAIPLAL